MSPIGDCSESQHGPIADWDVSAVTDMRSIFFRLMFSGASAFNQDLSNWDVSVVAYMDHMFSDAKSFNQDLSDWDVSAVSHMQFMFSGASAFKHELCGIDWVKSKAKKRGIFKGSQGSISSTVCTTTSDG